MVGEQLSFDIEAMLHQDAVETAPVWAGAPLHFTSDYFPPDELDAALEHWRFLRKHDKTHVQSRMWRRALTVPGGLTGIGAGSNHGYDLFNADLRCEPWKHSKADGEQHADCACVGDLTYMAICEPCSWRVIADDENSAVEGWHDHAFPGWRDLPIVPGRLRDIDKTGLSKAARRWIEERYPPTMQAECAPVITERQPMGTRHVPGRSPWGGYDISHTAVDPNRNVEPRRRPRTPTSTTDRSAQRSDAATQPLPLSPVLAPNLGSGVGLGD